ncbi:MAG: hypothetical protein IPP53_00760 [Bacteroidetes bacterium]|nr:hypothetical protein [Bacteroidota bacterium]
MPVISPLLILFKGASRVVVAFTFSDVFIEVPLMVPVPVPVAVNTVSSPLAIG